MHLGEVLKDTVLNWSVSSRNVDSDVVGQVLLLVRVLGKGVVQSSSLGVLTVSSLPVEWACGTGPHLLVLLLAELTELNWLRGGKVVRLGAQVTVHVHGTVSHVRVVDSTSDWAVNWDLSVVNTQSVSVGVWVREQSRLQDWVSRWLLVWNRVGWGESSLLNLSKVVLWVLVQGQLTESSQWVVLVWPDLGQVKDGEWSLLGLLGSHRLEVDSPGWEVTLGNVNEQVLLGVVWVGTGKLASLLVGQTLAALVRDQVDLDVSPVTVLGRPLVGVTGVTVHLSVRGWGTTVREQNDNLVDGLWVAGQVVPEHVGVLQVGLWVSLLGVDKVGELRWVSDEENWGVVVNPVQVTLLSVELGGETSWVSGSVRRTGLTTDGGESGEGSGLLTNSVKQLGGTDVRDVVSHLKDTVGTGTLGVDNSLWNSLSVKVGKRVDKVEVLQKQRTVLADPLGGERLRDWATVGVGKSRGHFCRSKKKWIRAPQLRISPALYTMDPETWGSTIAAAAVGYLGTAHRQSTLSNEPRPKPDWGMLVSAPQPMGFLLFIRHVGGA